jgi:hypothetical protein
MAELLGVLGELLLHRVGQERGNLCSTRGDGAEGKADQGAAQPGLPGAPPVFAVHPGTVDVDDLGGITAQVRGDPERLADREQAHRDHDDVDPVSELGDAEGEPLLAGGRVDADRADEQSDAERSEAPDLRRPQHRGHGDEGQHHDREVVRRAELDRELDDLGRDEGQREGADGARDERPDRRGGQGRSATALLGHQVAFDGCDDRRALAWCVEQDRSG